MEDPALQAVHKYQRHPSLLAIREKYKDLNFSFSNVNLSAESTKWIKKFRLHQVSAWNWYYYYSTQREYRYIFSPALLNSFDNKIDSSSFPYHLKLANTTRVNKKHSQNYKRNYRPVSVLSNQGINLIKHIKSFWKYFESADFCTLWKYFLQTTNSKQVSMHNTVFKLCLKNKEKHKKRVETMLRYLQHICQKHSTAYLMV